MKNSSLTLSDNITTEEGKEPPVEKIKSYTDINKKIVYYDKAKPAPTKKFKEQQLIGFTIDDNDILKTDDGLIFAFIDDNWKEYTDEKEALKDVSLNNAKERAIGQISTKAWLESIKPDNDLIKDFTYDVPANGVNPPTFANYYKYYGQRPGASYVEDEFFGVITNKFKHGSSVNPTERYKTYYNKMYIAKLGTVLRTLGVQFPPYNATSNLKSAGGEEEIIKAGPALVGEGLDYIATTAGTLFRLRPSTTPGFPAQIVFKLSEKKTERNKQIAEIEQWIKGKTEINGKTAATYLAQGGIFDEVALSIFQGLKQKASDKYDQQSKGGRLLRNANQEVLMYKRLEDVNTGNIRTTTYLNNQRAREEIEREQRERQQKDPENKDPEHKDPENKDPEHKDPEYKEPQAFQSFSEEDLNLTNDDATLGIRFADIEAINRTIDSYEQALRDAEQVYLMKDTEAINSIEEEEFLRQYARNYQGTMVSRLEGYFRYLKQKFMEKIGGIKINYPSISLDRLRQIFNNRFNKTVNDYEQKLEMQEIKDYGSFDEGEEDRFNDSVSVAPTSIASEYEPIMKTVGAGKQQIILEGNSTLKKIRMTLRKYIKTLIKLGVGSAIVAAILEALLKNPGTPEPFPPLPPGGDRRPPNIPDGPVPPGGGGTGGGGGLTPGGEPGLPIVPTGGSSGEATELEYYVDPAEAELFKIMYDNQKEEDRRWNEYSFVASGHGLGNVKNNALLRREALENMKRFKNTIKTVPTKIPFSTIKRSVKDDHNTTLETLQHSDYRAIHYIPVNQNSYNKEHWEDAFYNPSINNKKILWSNPNQNSTDSRYDRSIGFLTKNIENADITLYKKGFSDPTLKPVNEGEPNRPPFYFGLDKNITQEKEDEKFNNLYNTQKLYNKNFNFGDTYYQEYGDSLLNKNKKNPYRFINKYDLAKKK